MDWNVSTSRIPAMVIVTVTIVRMKISVAGSIVNMSFLWFYMWISIYVLVIFSHDSFFFQMKTFVTRVPNLVYLLQMALPVVATQETNVQVNFYFWVYVNGGYE